MRLRLCSLGWRGRAPRPTPPMAVPVPPAEDALRAVRADATADHQARVTAFVELPEAQGIERFALELAGTDMTLDQARAVLRTARRSACQDRMPRAG